jgi:hypothetical protein
MVLRNLVYRLDDIQRRAEKYHTLREAAGTVHALINGLHVNPELHPGDKQKLFAALGLCLDRTALWTLIPSHSYTSRPWSDPDMKDREERIPNSKMPATVKVHRVCLANRNTPTGDIHRSLIVTLSQRRKGYLDAARQRKADKGQLNQKPDFYFHGGCTLVIDTCTLDVRYAIHKSITNEARLEKRRNYELGKAVDRPSLKAAYFEPAKPDRAKQPFAHLHGLEED